MYCKKCGKDYPKNKKVCKDCGAALVPGTSPTSKHHKNRGMIIGAIVGIVVVISVFLIIGLTGMVPADLKGTWYETTGMGGTLEFKASGVLAYTIYGDEGEGTYEYNSATGEGSLSRMSGDEEVEFTFTCDGTTITMDDVIYTKEYVEQVDFSDIFESLLDE